MKEKTHFVCEICGAVYPRWQGRCDQCGNWNSITEVKIPKSRSKAKSDLGESKSAGKIVSLSGFSVKTLERIKTGSVELDRVLGGGMVPGATILVGGPPGIGKSTLLLQTAHNVAKDGKRVLYLSGEESTEQIMLRASRLGTLSENLFLLTEPDLSQFMAEFSANDFSLVVIDSIQSVFIPTVLSSAGSVAQIRESVYALSEVTKSKGVPLFLVGHITKEGTIAGPKLLEHMVDVVLYFEEESRAEYRLLKVFKNRYGVVGEIGVFRMTGCGLEDVLNPSEIFVSPDAEKNPGSVVSVGIEGIRPFLLEIQALVSASSYTYPQRVIRGLDIRRTLLLLAIIEKRVGIPLSKEDCFINIVGGIHIDDPALDVAVVLAVVSSFRDIPVKEKTIALGELGLTGEIKPIANLQPRLKEIQRLGYRRAIIPCNMAKKLQDVTLEIIEVANLFDVFRSALETN